MEKSLSSEKKHEEEYTSYSFDSVEENANPLEYFEEDEDAKFNQRHQEHINNTNKHYKKLNRLFSTKEVFDRVAYGLAAHQFISILFFLSGAGAFLVGIVYALRSALSGLIASFVREYSKLQTVPKKIISRAGIIFGFSFIGLVLAIRLHSPILFATFLLIGSLGIVTYGELYDRLLKEGIKYERKNKFLKNITHLGLIITAVAFLVSGAIIQFIGMNGNKIIILGYTIPITGYFVVFELSAIMFIITGFVLSKIPLKNIKPKIHSVKEFIKIYYHEMKEQTKQFLTNKNLLLLSFGAIIISCVEILGSAYYGYVIYEMYKNVLFGGFFNVAIIFGVAIFASFLGPLFTKFLHKHTGLTPMFVFGSLLIAILPLTIVLNQHFFAVLAAASCAVIGSSILGVAQALIARKILPPSLRRVFFHSIELLLVIPFLILVPIGAFIAWYWSFNILFITMVVALLAVVVPLYLILVLKTHRKRL